MAAINHLDMELFELGSAKIDKSARDVLDLSRRDATRGTNWRKNPPPLKIEYSTSSLFCKDDGMNDENPMTK